ncbi:UNVERIFIED_CONTAM: hypothetical protein FKN15_069760 [Acipenser sinensis]
MERRSLLLVVKRPMMEVSWSPDSTRLLSASGDKTAKIWDVANNSVVTTFDMGSDVLDQQLGCLWQKDHLLTVSLSGYINYLDKNNPNRPLRTIKVTYKNIQLNVYIELVLCKFSHYWDAETGENGAFSGKGHSNLVSRMAVDESNQLVSCGMDDTVRFTSVTKKEYSASDLVKMDVQPKCVAVGPGGYAVAVCIGQLVLLKDKKKGFGMDNLGYEPEAAAVHPGGVTVAVGGSMPTGCTTSAAWPASCMRQTASPGLSLLQALILVSIFLSFSEIQQKLC